MCQTASPLSNAWPLISGCLKTEKPQNGCSKPTCGGTSLHATTYGEAIKCVPSFPGADSCTGAPVPSGVQQCWPHWSQPGWWAAGSVLAQRSTCKLYLLRLWASCGWRRQCALMKIRRKITVSTGTGAYFQFVYLHILYKWRQNIIFMNGLLSFRIDTNECKALSPSCLYHQIN